MWWAALLIGRRIFNRTGIKEIYAYKWLLLFLSSGFLTIFIYFSDNFMTNFYLMYHGVICFILFYGMHATEEKEAVKKEVFSILAIFVKISTIVSVLGFFFLFTIIRIEAFGYRMGLNGIRFTGLYTHPNIAAFISVVGIISCHIVWRKPAFHNANEKLVPDWICRLGIVLNVLTIFLSDSNAALLFVIGYLMVFLFWKEYKKNKKIAVGFIVRLLIFCVVIGGTSLVVRSLCQDGIATVVDFIQKTQSGEGDPLTIGREEREDLSSGRMDSFMKAFLLLKEKPLLGVGKGNIVAFGERYLVEGFRFFDLHNGYLTILVSCGIVGFAFFAIFLFATVKKGVRGLLQIYNQKKDNQDMIISLAAFLCGYGGYAMLERTILFDVTFMVAVFWLLLGYLMVFIQDTEKEKK